MNKKNNIKLFLLFCLTIFTVHESINAPNNRVHRTKKGSLEQLIADSAVSPKEIDYTHNSTRQQTTLVAQNSPQPTTALPPTAPTSQRSASFILDTPTAPTTTASQLPMTTQKPSVATWQPPTTISETESLSTTGPQLNTATSPLNTTAPQQPTLTTLPQNIITQPLNVPLILQQPKPANSFSSSAPAASTLAPLPLELQTKKVDKQTATTSSPIELEKKSATESEDEKIEFHFEDADLQTLVTHVEELFNVTFITDDMIQPLPSTGHALKGNKITFKTNKLLSKEEAWNLFITFLSMANFAIVPDENPRYFKIKTTDAAKKSPIKTFIGTTPTSLPGNDELIRYVYFMEHKQLNTVKDILNHLKSVPADLIFLDSHNAFILTDKAYNIKTLMQIVKELDKVSMPQSLSVLKLRNADAQEVKALYESLLGEKIQPQQFFQARKQPTSLYFPENTTIIAEPRTNSLILLGTKDAINKIETFIVKHIDVELDTPYSPLYVHQLKYANASAIADIMSKITSEFGQDKQGGLRGSDKFMRPINFVAEEATNRIIIKGHYDDYIAAKDIIEKLDEAQPQVAIEVLILSISLTNQKQLGTQIRSKDPGVNGLLGNNVKFQTSGLYQTKKVVLRDPSAPGVTTGAARLLGNLVDLATGAIAGNTLITLGSDAYGVWGIFQALQTAANAQIVSNPFLLATNKTKATIKVGETRRVQTGIVFSGGSSGPNGGTATLGDEEADLTVAVIPQINSDGMIVLDLEVNLSNFLNPQDPNSATKANRNIKTHAVVANKEVLALGGLVRNNINNTAKKTPVLGDIPILGWLFKNQSKLEDKDNLLILLSARIIEPHSKKEVHRFNTERIDDYHGTLAKMNNSNNSRDPIQKLFFAPDPAGTEQVVDDFLLRRAHLEENTEPKKLLSHRKAKKLRRRQLQNKSLPVSPDLSSYTAPTVIAQPSYQELLNTKIPMPIAVQKNLAETKNNSSMQTVHTQKKIKLSLTDFLNDAGAQA